MLTDNNTAKLAWLVEQSRAMVQPEPTAPADRLLTLSEAAKIVPLSAKTLYRVAQRGDGPFRKVEGRWMVYGDELHEWVRSHPVGGASSAAAPRPRQRRRGSGMRARVLETAE